MFMFPYESASRPLVGFSELNNTTIKKLVILLSICAEIDHYIQLSICEEMDWELR